MNNLSMTREEANEEMTFCQADSAGGNENSVGTDEPIYVNRFDFTLNDQYYIMNIKLDENGERIQSFSNL